MASRRILVIAGCIISGTPVVNAYLQYLAQERITYDLVEFEPGRRLEFVLKGVKTALKRTYEKVIFINFQSLPVLFLSTLFSPKDEVYWKLESNTAFENGSLVLKLQLLEWVVPRKSTTLVVPNESRLKAQHPKFLETFVLPNAPLRPYLDKDVRRRSDQSNGLVMYGNLEKSSDLYVKEWERFVENNGISRISFIGKYGGNTERIRYVTRLDHDSLIQELCMKSYLYSIVGYKPVGVNTLLAAPNKLIESLACGIPVIGHIKNDYVAEIVSDHNCGFLLDFDDLDYEKYVSETVNREKHAENALLAAEKLCIATKLPGSPMSL